MKRGMPSGAQTPDGIIFLLALIFSKSSTAISPSPWGSLGIYFAPTGAVCRSGITLPVSTGASPTRRERRTAFPGSRTRRRHLAGRVPRAKRLGRRRRNPATSVEHDFVQFQRGFEDGVDLFDEGLEMRSLHMGVEGGVVFPGFDE